MTLLLGRNGGVAAVGEASLAQDLVYGLVLSVENTTYEDSDGNSYNTRTATIFGTDGNTYRYPVESRSLEAGTLVRVTNSEDGVEIPRPQLHPAHRPAELRRQDPGQVHPGLRRADHRHL